MPCDDCDKHPDPETHLDKAFIYYNYKYNTLVNLDPMVLNPAVPYTNFY